MDRLLINIGEKVIFKEKECIIIKIIDINTVSIEEIFTNIIHTVTNNSISPFNSIRNYHDIQNLSEDKWQKALKRFEIIKPILLERRNVDLVKNVASQNHISIATLYRWVKEYTESGLVSSLVGKNKGVNVGKSKLPKILDNIINDKLHSVYLSNSRHSIIKTIREIEMACKDMGIKAPHSNTIRNRIKNISEEERIRKRYGNKAAREIFEPIKGNFPGANYPLSVVQIDHTPVDIILVDNHFRQPYHRPYLTLAIDIYSRAILGFYLSFDPPSSLSVGMCICHSILPKENWLESIDVNTDWDCWGIMDSIHVDNAKEFHGNMLRKATQEYGIDLNFRPIATPHFGGHIERTLGTFSKEIHDLPGTTFSSIKDRDNYDSKKNASFTLEEFERWLTIYITKIYHKRIHSSINETPINKFKKGILGDNTTIGKGIPPRIFNERKVRLDFMPFVERTIQEYGIVLNHIYYYDDVLRSYINSKDEKGNKIKYIFRTDPRDISIVYFFDPFLKEYFEIPYKNTSFPPMSIWEHRDIIRKLKKNNIGIINEDAIFSAYRELEEIERTAVSLTKKEKRKDRREIIPQTEKVLSPNKIIVDSIKNEIIIEPFEDIE
ncbi:DDE-type integrase/transposase/recombinase [Flavobacterium sp. CFS9]|uniref:DDE-type integrase/transposase/recombinase n=1 Tax=Flavobacterium sp. CFS9 TaxID=3143118 RepID=A0AAT9H304_9FLAO